jgi:hypothetical protein
MPRLHRPPPVTIVRRHSERSAARLAHQSGGLGVPSSNLGAPTNKIKYLSRVSLPNPHDENASGQTRGRRRFEGCATINQMENPA